jgi:hypothetical protein
VEKGLSCDDQTGQEITDNNQRGVRIPCKEVYHMYINMHIAKMGFEECVYEDAGREPD